MRKVYIQNLRPGMVLGGTIRNQRGDVLLSKGVVLSEGYIDALRAHGFYAVYIMDGIADDVEPPDILSDHVRMATYKHVHELFAVARGAAASGGANGSNDLPDRIAGAAAHQVAQLHRDIAAIIDEVMSAEVLSGVVSLKSHDSYTFEHSIEVTVAGVVLGKRLNIASQELYQLALGCMLHDVGKLVIPPEVLSKPSRLTPEEFDLVRRHPLAGYEIVRQMTGEGEILARHLVWQHHERQDGTGYPRGLRGINEFGYARQEHFGQGLILPAAEIAAVADVYSALASDRPYRPALSPLDTVSALRQMAGSHLNRKIVSRFLSILPTYPVGTEVVVAGGKLEGYRGIVTHVDPAHIHRPTVRILFDPTGRRVTPFHIDTSREREMDLAIPSCAEAACARAV